METCPENTGDGKEFEQDGKGQAKEFVFESGSERDPFQALEERVVTQQLTGRPTGRRRLQTGLGGGVR